MTTSRSGPSPGSAGVPIASSLARGPVTGTTRQPTELSGDGPTSHCAQLACRTVRHEPTTSTGAFMTTSGPTTSFAEAVTEERLQQTAAALREHGFTVEILDGTAAARSRLRELIPEGAGVFTGASETLRLSGIEEDINAGGRYDAIRPRGLAMDRATQMDEIRRLLASPDVVVGSVAAVTETGSLVAASGSGSQLPAYSGGAGRRI